MKALKLLKFEIWEAKFYLVCELPAWWKSIQKHPLTKLRGFERFAASKTWKCKLYSFFHTPPWWKQFKFIFCQKEGLEQSGSWENEVNLFQSHFNQHCQTLRDPGLPRQSHNAKEKINFIKLYHSMYQRSHRMRIIWNIKFFTMTFSKTFIKNILAALY